MANKLTRCTNKQKKAIEKITGKFWDIWCPEAVRAYFAFTDRGQDIAVSDEAKGDLFTLIKCHKNHAWLVEYWKKDFLPDLENNLPPILYLSDFFGHQPDYDTWVELGCPDEMPTLMYPEAFQNHALEIFQGAIKSG